jgi:predicted GH43/DUF377 family glycosyl hydrolase
MGWKGFACGLALLIAPALQAQSFWETFSNDYPANCLAWTRESRNPVIAPSGSTWKSQSTADPELFEFGDRTLLYYCGNGTMPRKGKGYHDRIGVAEVLSLAPMQLNFRDLNNGSPVIDVGEPGDFDDRGVRGAAAVWFKGLVHLYYGAIGHGPNNIGLATSNDGEHFVKVGKVLEGRAPDAIASGDTLYLLYHKRDSVGYKVHLAVSTDGVKFSPLGNKPVFSGQPNRWDAKSVVTARVWKSGAWFYLLYGGSADRVDEPDYFGLARSRDMLHWDRHPGNPVFGAGSRGTADGGVIWFPALFDAGSWFVMLYEGSRGRYAWDLSSGICMAWIPKR